MDPCKKLGSPKHPLIVKDYRPYTGRQLVQRPSVTENHKQNIHRSSWDLYYRNNTINGFKDRNYILREFVELREAVMGSNSTDQEETSKDMKLHPSTGVALGSHSCDKTSAKPFSWMEAGCGVGNTMLPIFKEFGNLSHWRFLLGFDISKVAIKLLSDKKASLPLLLQEKIHVFALNPCEQRIADFILPTLSGGTRVHPSASCSNSLSSPAVDFVSMVFVLSAIPVSLYTIVLKRIAECMVCPGGVFFFRDYARSDLAEKRFQSRRRSVIGTVMENINDVNDNISEEKESSIFLRTNGTLTHFFSKDELVRLFTSVGFSVIEVCEVNRDVENRKAALCMRRKFLQGRFRLEKGITFIHLFAFPTLCSVMGVHGLWRLLDTFGVVTRPEEWSGCRVAIDASIWIAQFRSQSLTEDASNRVIQGFFIRILKLLFYGIEPVFVFDGPSLALKAKEHRRRQKIRKNLEQSLLKRRAQQILSALASSGHLDIAHLKRKREPSEESTEVLEVQPKKLCTKQEAVPLLHENHPTICTETPFGYKKSQLTCLGSPNNIVNSHTRSCHKKGQPLVPAEVSKTTMISFLKEAKDIIEERKKGEQCVLNNTLRYSSSSLFMGPRCALLSEKEENNSSSSEILDCGIPDNEIAGGASPYQCHSDVVLINADDDDSSKASSIALTISSSCEKSNGGAFVVQQSADASVGKEQTDIIRDSTLQKQFSQEIVKGRTLTKQSLNALRTEKEFKILEESKLNPKILSVDDSLVSDEILSELSTSITSSVYVSYCEDSDGEFNTTKASDETSFLWDPSNQRQYEQLAAVLEAPPHSGPLKTPKENGMNSSLANDFTPANLSFSRQVSSRSGTGLKCNDSHNRMSLWPTATTEEDVGERAKICNLHPFCSGNQTLSTDGINKSDTKMFQRCASPEGEQLTLLNPTPPTTRVPHLGRDRQPTPQTVGSDTCFDPQKQTVPFELLGIVNMLTCFQIPYVISPSEADAQCAYLARNGLVDAVFTEDSDVVVHGAPVILRGFFSSNKNAVAYRQEELEACGIDKPVLVALALFMGCDYAEGISGLGLSGAMEALVSSWIPISQDEEQERNDPQREIAFVIRTLFRWKLLLKKMPASWTDAGDSDLSLLQFLLFRKNKSSWSSLYLPESFPEHGAAEAFYEPLVDLDRTPFVDSNPQWQRVWGFAVENGLLESSWVRKRLELAQKEWVRRRIQNNVSIKNGYSQARQRHLKEFGVKTKIGEKWVYRKQPLRLSNVLAQLRDIKELRSDTK